MALNRVQAGEDHRLQLLEARKRLRRRTVHLGDRVADLRIGHALDVGDQEADLADAKLLDRYGLRRKDTEAVDLVVLSLCHQLDLHLRLHHAVDHAHDDDDPAVRVVPGVEDERLERRVCDARWRMEASDHRLEDVLNAGALLGARQDGVGTVEADDVFDLTLALVGLRARQVDLVDDRNDLQVVLDGEVRVGERLRLDALRGIDQQQRPLAGCERPGHFVAEVDMPRGVDEVQDVLLTRLARVVQADRMRLDRDAALPLEIHRVEDLRLHLAWLQGAGQLEETIGQRRLAMVDVRDDREVADVALVH